LGVYFVSDSSYRFGTNFLMVQRLLLVKPGLQQMVVSKQWKDWVANMSAAEKSTAQEIEDQVLDNITFWPCVAEINAVMEPAFILLRELEGDEPNAAAVYFAAADTQDQLKKTPPGLVFSKRELKNVLDAFLDR
jgi:hypothetical protein